MNIMVISPPHPSQTPTTPESAKITRLSVETGANYRRAEKFLDAIRMHLEVWENTKKHHAP